MRLAFLVLCVVVQVLAVPRAKKKDLQADVVVREEYKPSFSLYDHVMGNLATKNRFVQLSQLPNGIPPPQIDDYDESGVAPVPIYNYAFVNPVVNGEKLPHWTETLENFKQNPAISPEVKDKVVQSLQTPIKIYGDGTESRFPLLVEYFVQRIQNYFSHYVYEDMSRPASWDSASKANASDHKPVSQEKEPVTEDSKVDEDGGSTTTTTVKGSLAGEEVDYIVDITLRPDSDDMVMEVNDEDFEKTTEEWEEKVDEEEEGKEEKKEEEEQKVVVEKELVDLKVIAPIVADDDAFIYVGDGNSDELLRSNGRGGGGKVTGGKKKRNKEKKRRT